MKKFLSVILIFVVVASAMLTLTSCAETVSGTYVDTLKVTTLDFSGNKVTITVDNIIGDDTVIQGTYEITEKDNGEKEIAFKFDSSNLDTKLWETPMFFSSGEENGKKFVKIGIAKYTEVK